MPDNGFPVLAVLRALGFVLFEREEAGMLRLLGEVPGWLVQLWPEVIQNDRALQLAEASPFLENFLIDAEECWRKGGTERAESGPWIEQDGTAEPVQLQAVAMTVAGRNILLLERLGEAFEARKTVLQRARETAIAHQRLNSEIQKKEILLHCVTDEMSAALANIITSLRLIELEDNGPRTKLLLGLATRATQEQQTLIHRILGAFKDELRNVYGAASDRREAASWSDNLRRALDSIAPLFEEKGVHLDAGEATETNMTLALNPAYLERVILNLLENTLERSAPGSTVVVRAKDEPESLLISFEDNGALLAPQVCERLFRKFQLGDSSTAGALRLHFCRIVLETSGGEIGCEPLSAGGNRFWMRLPKSGASG